MSEIVRLGFEHRQALSEFFSKIDRPEITVNFKPHDLTPGRAEELCRYRGADEYRVAVEDGRILAYGMLRGWDEGYETPSLGLCVRPGDDRRGVGSAMMEHLIAAAKARGSSRVILKVKRANAAAVAFYRRFGFELTDLDPENWRGTLALAKDAPDLSLILPAIDEAANLAVLVPRLREVFAPEKAALEILVIDWRSTDKTAALAESLGCRVAAQTAPGYAQAIRDGIALASGDFVVVMDADQSHAPEDVLRLYQNRHKADIVINSRYAPGGGSDTSWWRGALSRLLNALYRRVLDLPYREISGGFRIYRREVLRRIRLTSRFYEVQEEMLILAHQLGFSAVEIPYRYRERGQGASKARVLEYGANLLWALAKFKAESERRASSRSPATGLFAAASALFLLSCAVSTWSIARNFEGGVAQEFCHYGEIGRNILEGRGYRTGLAYPSTLAYLDAHAIPFRGDAPVIDRFPLFAYLLAGAERLGGANDVSILMVSVVLLGLFAAATFAVGCRFFSPWSAAAAGLFVALDPSFQRGFVLWSYPDFCFALLVLASIALIADGLDDPKTPGWRWAAAGAFAGLAWLTRSNLKLWLPLFLGIFWLPPLRGQAFRRAALFVGAMAVVSLPAIAYNLRWFKTLDSPGVTNWLPQYVVMEGLPGAAYRLFDPWSILRDHFPALMRKFWSLLLLHLKGFPPFWQMHLLFPMAIVGFFQPMPLKARRFIVLALAMLAVQMLVFSTLRYEALGAKVGGRYFLWFAPAAFLLAAHGAAALSSRFALRWLAPAFAALNLAFFAFHLGTPQGARADPRGLNVPQWPELAAAARAAGESGLVATNIPGQVVWYARRPALFLPQEPSDFEAIDRRHPIAAILLSRLRIGELPVLPFWARLARDPRALEEFGKDHGFRVVEDFGGAVVLERAARAGLR